jgi:hypothetical protein
VPFIGNRRTWKVCVAQEEKRGKQQYRDLSICLLSMGPVTRQCNLMGMDGMTLESVVVGQEFLPQGLR